MQKPVKLKHSVCMLVSVKPLSAHRLQEHHTRAWVISVGKTAEDFTIIFSIVMEEAVWVTTKGDWPKGFL